MIGVEDPSPCHSPDSCFQRSNESDSKQESELQEQSIEDAPSTSRFQMTESLATPMRKSSAKSLAAALNSEGSKSGKGKSRRSKILYNEMLD